MTDLTDSHRQAPPSAETAGLSAQVRFQRPRLTRVLLAISLAVGGCSIDLWTKAWVFGWLGPPQPGQHNIWWIWQPYIGFETSINTGALFGMGQGQVTLFAVISVVALGGIVYWFWLGGASQDLWLTICLGLVSGGILGNFYDRLGLWGMRGVRDWILLRYGTFTWPNFNVADSLLVCGAVMLAWHAFRAGPTASGTPGEAGGEPHV